MGVKVRGYEGATNAEEYTRSLIHHADLTKQLHLPAAEWVLCIGAYVRDARGRVHVHVHVHGL